MAELIWRSLIMIWVPLRVSFVKSHRRFAQQGFSAEQRQKATENSGLEWFFVNGNDVR